MEENKTQQENVNNEEKKENKLLKKPVIITLGFVVLALIAYFIIDKIK